MKARVSLKYFANDCNLGMLGMGQNSHDIFIDLDGATEIAVQSKKESV